ncbi:Anaerobic nitric oxide reductase flavorubredoxin [Streptomyces sp. RB5]|uniref:Anaerobic nitric oxide reductase flavorubredoxin n=1 Tax=Streptomyces smaragdinus TaxID=2585196 RepID=A0A7K0CG78_9ACTN|nr:MBL fold metallo-hydrolase [Streptomyces smaragdinus]MQY12479.1 Anaerobic nitric oxide reductase flavorubredoxin [Streptomyces smaragdinus]
MHIGTIGDVHALRDRLDVPGMGFLPVNAFVVHADEPVLVDTGLPGSRAEFLDAVGSVVDLRDLAYVWLTHPDRDHLGALDAVLELAPRARLVCTASAAGYLALGQQVPEERIHVIAPGESLPVGGGRRLRAFRPPLYDNPMTVGFLDSGNGACVTSDCFGAMLPTADSADAADIADLDPAAVRAGQTFWAGVDSPWVHVVDPRRFAATYEDLRRFRPGLMLGAHLPPAADGFDGFLDLLADLPLSTPDQLPPGDLLDRAVDDHLDRVTPR